MKKSLILILGMALVGCSTPMKSIKRNHNGSLNTVFNKYRHVLNEHDWEIEKSDANGGFLKAIRGQKSLGMIIGVFSTTISCSGGDKVNCFVKIRRCDNSVPLTNCSTVSEYAAKNDLEDFIADIKSVR